ncbi:MAG: hypothetical protein WAM30_00215 [Candidatus Dormiibacterota bacterium]
MPRPNRRRRHDSPRRIAPARPLATALRRRELARAFAESVAGEIDRYLDLDRRLARRRSVDRFRAGEQLLLRLAAWGSLIAPPEERALAGQLIGAAIVLAGPADFAWYALAEGGLEAEARAALRGAATEAAALAERPYDAAEVVTRSSRMPQQLRRLVPRVRERSATANEVRTAAAALLVHQVRLAMSESLAAEVIDAEEAIATEAACVALGVEPPIVDALFPSLLSEGLEHEAQTLDVGLQILADELPDDGFDPVAAFAVHDDDEDEEDKDEEDKDEEEGFGDDEPLATSRMLRDLDGELRFVENASAAAPIAYLAANVLTIAAAWSLRELPVPLDLSNRILAAAHVSTVLVAAGGQVGGEDGLEATREDPLDPIPVHDDAELRDTLVQAVAVLSTELPPVASATSTVEERLGQLDTLIVHLGEPESDDRCQVVEGLAQAAGAAEAAGLAVALAGDDPELRRRAAALLGVLDPLTLMADPQTRAAAAESLQGMVDQLEVGVT